jgi:hypothetical protein
MLSFALITPLLALGCSYETGSGEDDGENLGESALALVADAFTNPTGVSRIASVNGAAIDENNPFFQSLGSNGRACVNCHQPSAAMGITPRQIQQVFSATPTAFCSARA